MILYLYRIVVWFLTPLIFAMLLFRSIREPEYRHRISERFGLLSSELSTGCVCFHTVSAGETISAAPVIKELIKHDQSLRILITTMTPTGSAMAKKIFGSGVEHSYLPYDYQFAVKRFFDLVQPRILILMETELWPNLVNEAAKRDIPVICINARLSERSARRYKFIRPLIKRLLHQVQLMACQYDGHVSRFIELGLDPEKARALGNMKFDLSVSPNLIADSFERRKGLGLDHRLIWIVASTHDGEEEIVLTVYKKLKKRYEDLLLVLVPRHPPRSKLVGSIFEREGNDLFCRIPITMTTAALGGDLEAPTLDGGKTRVKIPQGSQNNKQLRLRGKGMPSIRGGSKGDLYIEILVETPVNLNTEQIKLLKQFEKSCENNSPANRDFFSKVKNFWNSN